MRRAVLDVEADDLLERATVCHSLVLRDMDSDAVLSCADQPGFTPIAEGLKVAAQAEVLYAHNGIGYDFPLLKKLCGWTYGGFVYDTLIAARTRWGDIRSGDFKRARKGTLPAALIGSHSLEGWGHRLGVLKGDYGKQEQAWAKWTDEMQRYCERDTLVTKVLVQKLEASGVPDDAVQTEMGLAWYLRQQERNGFPFDVDKAIALQAEWVAKREAAGKVLREVFGTWLAPNGVTNPKRSMKRKDGEIVAGCPYTKLKRVEFSPSSRDHIAHVLIQKYGWTPTVFNEGNGKPTLDDDTLASLDFPEKDTLLEYLLLTKRLGQLAEGKQAWLKLMRNDGAEGGRLTGMFHIHGEVNQNGAITHRATHKNPNMTQVPKVASPYGPECRGLFRVPPGWLQMGADVSGLELRCLAHYTAKWDGGAYGKIILEGDIHTANREALGEFVPQDKEGRDKAKTFIYAYLYGAGDEELGSIVAPTKTGAQQKRIGKQLRKTFERNIPALGLLAEGVRSKANEAGYVNLIDGRRAPVRSEHTALNTLLQGTGAVICKRWIVTYSERMAARYGEQGWRGQWAALVWAHDEIQNAVRPEIADDACRIAVESIESQTDHFHFRIPLTGEAKLGASWAECH